MIIIQKKKKIILKKQSVTIEPLTKIKAHFSWPVQPDESETVLQFISLCHEKEIQRGWRAARDIIQRKHEMYSGELSTKGGDERETLMRKARVAYWIQRCEYERTGRELSQSFWDNYDAAFADCLDRLDPVFVDAFTMKEEKTMATKFVVKKKAAIPAKEEQGTPAPVTKKAKLMQEVVKKQTASSKKDNNCPFRAGSSRAAAYAICKKSRSMEAAIKSASETGDKNIMASIGFVHDKHKKDFSW